MEEHERQTPRVLDDPCPRITPKPQEWVEQIERIMGWLAPKCTECQGPLAFQGRTGNVDRYRCCKCGANQDSEVINA